MLKIDELLSEIESLPIDMKTELIDKLISSMHPSQKEIDVLWAAEAEKRVDEIKSGRVQTIPGEQILSEAKKMLSK
jgi:putative addiction module component (TIGR02574 family)